MDPGFRNLMPGTLPTGSLIATDPTELLMEFGSASHWFQSDWVFDRTEK
jgi:hypothetical protein